MSAAQTSAARTTAWGRLEDAVAARLGGLKADIKPADEAGWRSASPRSCRVICAGARYSPAKGLGAGVQLRRFDLILSWRFRATRSEAGAYAFLDAACAALTGWAPRAGGARIAGALHIQSERLIDIADDAWSYEQRFGCSDHIVPAVEEEVLARVARIDHLDAAGGDWNPPSSVQTVQTKG